MRILHLFDALTDPLPHTRLALLACVMGRIAEAQDDLCLLGHQGAAQAARALGLRPRWRLAAPGRRAVMAMASVRRLIPLRDYDLIHCWSADVTGSATLAALLAPRTPRVVTVTQSPLAHQARWARMLHREAAPTTWLPINASIRHDLLTRGLPASAVHTLLPGVDLGLATGHGREALRRRWGVDDGRRVVALLGDPANAADCLDAQMAVGVADQALRPRGPGLALLVHPRQRHRLHAMHMARELDLRDNLLIDDVLDRPWEALAGCDMALAMGPAAGGLPLLWAMAANVPIAAEATRAVCEYVEDRHSALLARPGVNKALAHRLTQLATDAPLAWKLRDTARHEAYSLFSRQRHVEALATVYRQVIARQPVAVPAMEATGGLRFAGRA